MALTEWNDRLCVGHGRIDSDHIRQLDLIDQLDDAVANHLGLEAYGKVLDELIANSRAHFAAEEDLMASHRYVQAEQHIAEHASLLRELEEFKARFDSYAITLSKAQLNWLEDWLTKHIEQSDKPLAASIPPD